jgi:sodium-dependent phosphate cotransporter
MKEFRQQLSRINNDEVIDLIKRVITVMLLLYLFLIGVKCLSGGLKMMGGDFAKTLFDLSGQPFISLMAGMLATVLFQSSSVTTAIIVGLVSAGTLSIGGAVPMIMGANLGTSVTNTLVSLGYMKDTANFKKAFAAATVHDFFNILSVLILLPLELATGFIEKSATYLSSIMYGSISGIKYSSPIKAAIKPPVKAIQSFTTDTFGSDVAGVVMMILAGIIIIAALGMIVKTMKVLVENNRGEIINRLLSKNAYGSIAFGAAMTVSVQSSSITTSLLIPMAGSGLLSMKAIYPITIGANIGTTATALLAALTGNAAGLSIALVHLLFNIFGTLIFFPIEKMRNIPIWCAEKLAESIERTKLIGFGYIGAVFFALPISMIYIAS